MLYRLTSEQNRGLAIALLYLASGLAGLVAPLVGGQIVHAAEGLRLKIWGWEFGSIHLLFFIRAIALLITVPLLSAVREPGSRSLTYVLRVVRRRPTLLLTFFRLRAA